MLAVRLERKEPLKEPALAATRTASEQAGHKGRWCRIGFGHCPSLSIGWHLRDGAPRGDPQASRAHINSLAVAAHRRGARSSSMVGMNSETVGWMCIARCKTVDGAFAYMTSRIQ